MAYKKTKTWIDPKKGLHVEFYENVLDRELRVKELSPVTSKIPWKQHEIIFFGPKKVPRMAAYYGDPGISYTYSRAEHQPLPWTANLLKIKEKVEKIARRKFNSCLAELYRDGNDNVSWYSDDEDQLGTDPAIAVINFGAERIYKLRPKGNTTGKQDIVITLPSKSLLLMKGKTQEHWKHSIPVRKKITEPMLQLTFRKLAKIKK